MFTTTTVSIKEWFGKQRICPLCKGPSNYSKKIRLFLDFNTLSGSSQSQPPTTEKKSETPPAANVPVECNTPETAELAKSCPCNRGNEKKVEELTERLKVYQGSTDRLIEERESLQHQIDILMEECSHFRRQLVARQMTMEGLQRGWQHKETAFQRKIDSLSSFHEKYIKLKGKVGPAYLDFIGNKAKSDERVKKWKMKKKAQLVCTLEGFATAMEKAQSDMKAKAAAYDELELRYKVAIEKQEELEQHVQEATDKLRRMKKRESEQSAYSKTASKVKTVALGNDGTANLYPSTNIGPPTKKSKHVYRPPSANVPAQPNSAHILYNLPSKMPNAEPPSISANSNIHVFDDSEPPLPALAAHHLSKLTLGSSKPTSSLRERVNDGMGGTRVLSATDMIMKVWTANKPVVL
ncbi:hypothetical protein BZG36_02988 [Bifiguratus adelaidae]|uniref:Uncharacterized protein n=1 Tax=Bifiguratus adelaidae TaxID=1938954 RepID=A0A261XYH1_9FUNG|nr:hypothetical protein BZG36_02988 [Bifiguratus adelaidae]